MKKKIFLAALILFVISGVFLSAESKKDQEIAIKTVLIEKIYSHSDGYKVLYRKSGYGFGNFYVPMRWFKIPAGTKEEPPAKEKEGSAEGSTESEKKESTTETHRGSMSGAKAQIIWGRKATYPYATLVYLDGEFDYIKLYLQKSFAHESWGVLPEDKDFSDEFAVTELFIQY